jgi:hypothetical protein
MDFDGLKDNVGDVVEGVKDEGSAEDGDAASKVSAAGPADGVGP